MEKHTTHFFSKETTGNLLKASGKKIDENGFIIDLKTGEFLLNSKGEKRKADSLLEDYMKRKADNLLENYMNGNK